MKHPNDFLNTPVDFENYSDVIDHDFQQKKIGQGEFGCVYEAKLKNYDRHIAVKEIPPIDNLAIDPTEKQIYLKQGRHENILKFYGFIEQGVTLYLFMELAQMSLDTYLKENLNSSRKPTDCKHYAVGITQGLHFMHQQNIRHGDIKNALKIKSVAITNNATSFKRRILASLGC